MTFFGRRGEQGKGQLIYIFAGCGEFEGAIVCDIDVILDDLE